MMPSSFMLQLKREFDEIVSESQCMETETPLPLIIMAIYLNHFGFIEFINARIPCFPIHCKYSPGVLAQLLVLVHFIPSYTRISLVSIFSVYEKMNLELLTGHKTDPLTGSVIRPDELNDDLFGRFLDDLYEYGCEKIFHDFTVAVRTTFSLPFTSILHFDATYSYSESEENDVKQIVAENFPHFGNPLDGTLFEPSWNEMMLFLLHEVYGPEFSKYIYISDCKDVTEEDILRLVRSEFPISFISCLPQNFHSKLSENAKCKTYEQNEGHYFGTCCNDAPDMQTDIYYASTIPVTISEFDMYVHVYKTPEKGANIERKVIQEQGALTAKLEKMCKKRFFSKEDAVCEMNSFLLAHSNSMIEVELEIASDVELKKPRGRPGKKPKPPEEVTRWKIVKLGMKRKEDKIDDEIRKSSTFCLITNVDPMEQSSQETLLLYKGENQAERQFHIVKRPMMPVTTFLKRSSRSKALLTILYLGALLHGVLQVISRIELR